MIQNAKQWSKTETPQNREQDKLKGCRDSITELQRQKIQKEGIP